MTLGKVISALSRRSAAATAAAAAAAASTETSGVKGSSAPSGNIIERNRQGLSHAGEMMLHVVLYFY